MTQPKNWLERVRLPWTEVDPRVVLLLALWLVLFLLTACLLAGRIMLSRPSRPVGGFLQTVGEKARPNATATPTSSAPTMTPGRLTALVLTRVGESLATLQTNAAQTLSTNGLTPGQANDASAQPGTTLTAGTVRPGTANPYRSLTPTWNPNTPVFRITSVGSPTPTWYLRYFTPRPTVIVPRPTATRTYTPRPTRTALPPTLQPTYRTATVAVAQTGTATARTATEGAFLTGTATVQTATAAVWQTGTATVQTATAVVVQTQTGAANQTATMSGVQTATVGALQTAAATALTATAVAQRAFAYSADEAGLPDFADLMVIAPDGSRRMVLYRAPDQPGALMGSWSPDRNWLVFEGICGVPPIRTLCRIRPDGIGLVSIPNLPEGQNTWPSWSPDGSRIVFVNTNAGGQSDLYTILPDGSGLVRLTDDAARDDQPDWSPDGRLIVFLSDRGGSGMDIYTLDISASPLPAPTQLTITASDEATPHYSPNGAALVYARQEAGQWDIFSAPSNDLSAPQLLTNSPADDLLPSWSPDGSQILFVSNRSGQDELFFMSSSGASPVAVPNTAGQDIARARWIP